MVQEVGDRDGRKGCTEQPRRARSTHEARASSGAIQGPVHDGYVMKAPSACLKPVPRGFSWTSPAPASAQYSANAARKGALKRSLEMSRLVLCVARPSRSRSYGPILFRKRALGFQRSDKQAEEDAAISPGDERIFGEGQIIGRVLVHVPKRWSALRRKTFTSSLKVLPTATFSSPPWPSSWEAGSSPS
jgi:hypothetical protein